MSTTWTAERLNALPKGTGIEWAEGGYPRAAFRWGWLWYPCDNPDEFLYSEWIIEDSDPGSIRVVSVPVDALLNPTPATVALGRIDPTSEGALAVLRAAIAHFTGETQ